MAGQINLGTIAGDAIYKLCCQADVDTIVESGTWNGLGSTMCVIQAQLDTYKKKFQSIELYKDQYDLACQNLAIHKEYVQLLNGSIISKQDLGWLNHNQVQQAIKTGSAPKEIDVAHAAQWYYNDLNQLETATNVLYLIHTKIDMLILDGGEYTTYPEWVKLKDRSTYVVLDDTQILKCSLIRSEILSDPNYKVIIDLPYDRNGFGIYKKLV